MEGPEQLDYPPIPRAELEAAIARIAAKLQARIVEKKYPTRIGDRSARFRAETAGGASIFIKMLGTGERSTHDFFQHEIHVLQALNANPPNGFNAPRLLNHEVEAEIVWMATEWINAERLVLSESTFRPLVSALWGIREMPPDIVVRHTCHKNHAPRGSSTYTANIESTTGRLTRIGLLSAANHGRIMRFVQHYAIYLDDYENICSTHGDFAPGNLTMRGDQVMVVDWESSHLDRGPIDVAHFVSTLPVWRSDLANQLETELWEHDREVLTLAKIERLAGRVNDTYRRRKEMDHNALWMLEDLVQVDLPS